MKDKENRTRKKITVFVPNELHKAASVKLAQKGGKPEGWSFQSVLEELLAEWSGGKREVAAPEPPMSGPERYRADLENLIEVLEHGTQEDRLLVRGMVRHHAESVRGRSQNPLQSGKKRANRG